MGWVERGFVMGMLGVGGWKRVSGDFGGRVGVRM